MPRSGADGDGDGISDASDACADTPAGDLVADTGCSVCPCDGGVSGWASRHAYLACVRGEARFRMAARTMDASGKRAALKHAKRATCGRPGRTRCCLPSGNCAVVSPRACLSRGGGDLGAGSCLPSPCD